MYAVNRKGVLGPICDVGWGDVDARVVCRYSDFGKSTFKFCHLLSFGILGSWDLGQARQWAAPTLVRLCPISTPWRMLAALGWRII